MTRIIRPLFFIIVWLWYVPLQAQEALSPVPDASVPRALFTTGIVDREPVDVLAQVTADTPEIYFFSELRGLDGRTVIHRWEYEGRVMAEVPFEVGGPRWRVYSMKTLSAELVGKWTVVVLDESGWPLEAAVLEVVSSFTEGATPAQLP